MTDAELRKHFDLKPCPNKEHFFEFGRLLVSWQWAEDNWSQLAGDRLQTFYLAINSTTNTKGTTIYSFTVWKLKIIFGWIQK